MSDQASPLPPAEDVKQGVLQRVTAWGKSSLPASLLATLILPLHARPLQILPLTIFLPPLLFSSYLNLQGYTTGSAGLTAAWSGLYALLAMRRRTVPKGLRGQGHKFGPRGLVRGAAVGLGAGNAVAGGLVYATGSFERDEEERVKRNRWTSK